MVRACDIPVECLKCNSGESGYRRGVAQALDFAVGFIRGGGSVEDLDELTDIVIAWRTDGKPHGALLDELLTEWLAHKKAREQGDAH